MCDATVVARATRGGPTAAAATRSSTSAGSWRATEACTYRRVPSNRRLASATLRSTLRLPPRRRRSPHRARAGVRRLIETPPIRPPPTSRATAPSAPPPSRRPTAAAGCASACDRAQATRGAAARRDNYHRCFLVAADSRACTPRHLHLGRLRAARAGTADRRRRRQLAAAAAAVSPPPHLRRRRRRRRRSRRRRLRRRRRRRLAAAVRPPPPPARCASTGGAPRRRALQRRRRRRRRPPGPRALLARVRSRERVPRALRSARGLRGLLVPPRLRDARRLPQVLADRAALGGARAQARAHRLGALPRQSTRLIK